MASTQAASSMEETIENAQIIINKWDVNSSSFTKVTSLFQHSRKEAEEFLLRVDELRRAMRFLITQNSSSTNLVLAQNLMQIAMKRLEKEFHQILSSNLQQLDPDSVSGRSSNRSTPSPIDNDGENVNISNLKLIADCMISTGHGGDCAKIYKLLRKTMVDEGLNQLGIQRYKSLSRIRNLNPESLEDLTKNWMVSVKIAVKTLFSGERVICDHLFSASNSIRESCFSDITKEGARKLLKFPQIISNKKGLPERIFRLIEIYQVLYDLLPDIEVAFSFESVSVVMLQAVSSLEKLGGSICKILLDFESSIQNDRSKTLTPGGGIHSLTRKAMNNISSLADYIGILSEIFAANLPLKTMQLPESYFDSPRPENDTNSKVAVHMAWLILVLLCNLDSKAKLYKDSSLAYLFRANNLHFIVQQVHSSKLVELLGDEWVSKHSKKVGVYATSYENLAWFKVFSTLEYKFSDEIAVEEAKVCFARFNEAFEVAYRKQSSCVVPDGKLRDELKISVAKKLLPAYRELYDTCFPLLGSEKSVAKIEPDDLVNYLSDLFRGTARSWSSSSSPTSSRCIPR